MSTDSVTEEKIMLNLIDLHKMAKVTIETEKDRARIDRDLEVLEKSLIKSPRK